MTRFMLTALAAAFSFTTLVTSPAISAVRDGLNTSHQQQSFERRKKRVKGGSGCDDAHDVAEHPECR